MGTNAQSKTSLAISSSSSATSALELATERATILLGCYRQGAAADPEIYTRAVIAVLMRYPAEVMIEVTEPATGLPSRLKWPPAIAELVEACEDSRALARIERERIAAQAKLMLPPRGPRTAEQQAEVDQQVENWRRPKLELPS